jgi:hypothetical protein
MCRFQLKKTTTTNQPTNKTNKTTQAVQNFWKKRNKAFKDF